MDRTLSHSSTGRTPYRAYSTSWETGLGAGRIPPRIRAASRSIKDWWSLLWGAGRIPPRIRAASILEYPVNAEPGRGSGKQAVRSTGLGSPGRSSSSSHSPPPFSQRQGRRGVALEGARKGREPYFWRPLLQKTSYLAFRFGFAARWKPALSRLPRHVGNGPCSASFRPVSPLPSRRGRNRSPPATGCPGARSRLSRTPCPASRPGSCRWSR